MNITVLGASGRVGSEIVKELARRGHQVTGVARQPARVPVAPGVTAVAGDVNQPASLAPALAGADAVVSAIMFVDSDPSLLIQAIKEAGVPRYLVVGGAGSLEIAPGLYGFVDLAVIRHGGFPAHAAEEADGFHGDSSQAAQTPHHAMAISQAFFDIAG